MYIKSSFVNVCRFLLSYTVHLWNLPGNVADNLREDMKEVIVLVIFYLLLKAKMKGTSPK